MNTPAYNPISGTLYQGKNAATLATGEWATFLQWQTAGRSIKKGEHGRQIIKFVEYSKKDSAGKVTEGHAPRVYTVFEKSQTQEKDTAQYRQVEGNVFIK